MSVRRDDGELVCECDDCGTEEYGGCEGDFAAFLQALKAEGWRPRKLDGTWTHLCPTCAEGT